MYVSYRQLSSFVISSANSNSIQDYRLGTKILGEVGLGEYWSADTCGALITYVVIIFKIIIGKLSSVPPYPIPILFNSY